MSTQHPRPPSTLAASPGETTFKDREKRNKGKIWWSNAFFFVSMHLFALYGATFLSPLTQLDWRTAALCFVSWQLAVFGITVGYHRLWSHRAFTATLPLRITLAWMGSMGFQGSIKWWVLRHRLHHRFTDSPVHDPYAATNGLLYSHCGWIFRKPTYPRMRLIERQDLESDPVVRFQHKHYVPIALFSGLILPYLVGRLVWNDGIGGFVWGGVVARLLIWHCTFCINSLAHWTGLQPYTEEVTARGNYLLAVLTGGEGNHNFHHAFPKDFRNGPHPADWDPTKWLIAFLHRYTSLVPALCLTPESSVLKARAHIHRTHADRLDSQVPLDERPKEPSELPVWSRREARRRNGEWVVDVSGERRRRVLLKVAECLVDVGGYLDDHPGGSELLLRHSISPLPSSFDASRDEEDPTDSGYFSASPQSGPSKGEPLSGLSSPMSVLSEVGSSSESEEGTNPLRSRRRGEEEQEKGVEVVDLQDATRAFFGGMNNHSAAAKERMRCLRVARLGD